MIFTSAPICSDPSNWNQPPHAQDQAGSYCSGATGSDNVIQLPPNFTLASNVGANSIVTGTTSLTANSQHLNKCPITEHLNKCPIPETSLKCPRCDSTNTKFCYFNNYSLSQPRHFCRACRRYWTRGGTIRNVPVGGGSRRNCKRTKAISSNSKSKRAGSKALPVICQIGTSSLSSDLGATDVRFGVPEMPMHLKLPSFPFTIGAIGTALPTELHVSNHLVPNSRYDKLLCGSNDATEGVNSTIIESKNNTEFQSGFSNVNYSSFGSIFP